LIRSQQNGCNQQPSLALLSTKAITPYNGKELRISPKGFFENGFRPEALHPIARRFARRNSHQTRRSVMASTQCSECDEEIDVTGRTKLGQKIICSHCGAQLEVVSTEPLEVEIAQEEEDDDLWEDDDLDEEELDDDLEEDEESDDFDDLEDELEIEDDFEDDDFEDDLDDFEDDEDDDDRWQ
jgi:lysine biosynthesis protein LysW